jgi:glycosyltransferase involved in cell wall biosynthesis
MDRRVTILIPSFNHAAFLPACLDSMLAQTHEDWAAVLVDDGSADDSVAIAKSYAGRDARIRVFENEENLGTYGTLQRTLEMADTPWVAVLNSDDFWESEKLALQFEALERTPEARFSYTLGGLADVHGEAVEEENPHGDWPLEERQDLLPWLLESNRVLASSVVFRREGLHFDPSLRYSGDWLALLERSAAGPAAYVPRPLTHWRQHGRNTYRQSRAQMLEEIRVRESIAARADDWLRAPANPAGVRRGLARNAMHLLALHAFFLNGGGVRRNALRALRFAARDAAARRRAMAALLPALERRKRLWPHADAGPSPGEAAEWRMKIRSLEPLALTISATR